MSWLMSRERPGSPGPERVTRARLEAELEHLREENAHLLEAHRELEEQRNFYTSAYHAIPVPVLMLDAHGIVRAANDATAALFRRPKTRFVNAPLRTLIDPKDRSALVRHLERCRAGAATVASELTILRRDQSPLPIELWSAHVQQSETFYPSAILDISDRVAARVERTELRDAERVAREESAAKDQFIASLSHELRTPLTPVLAAVSSFTARASAHVPTRQMMEMIERNVVAEARLIDDLLDAARIRRGKLQI